MILKVVEDLNYRDMLEGQIFDVIEYLVNNNAHFSITANIKGASFSPEIPEPISKNFPPFTMFSLMNFTFESIELSKTHLSFEAGFGSENFGSVVTMPLYSIFQIILDESILFLNPTATVDKHFIEKKTSLQEDETQTQRSMNAFSMNKNNKGLL